jgi:hypothetical protein
VKEKSSSCPPLAGRTKDCIPTEIYGLHNHLPPFVKEELKGDFDIILSLVKGDGEGFNIAPFIPLLKGEKE